MKRIETFLGTIDYSLNTKRKRHIAGGILISMSLFFGSLATTIITIKKEDENP